MAHSADDALRRGWHELALWVLEGNARARRSYERAGLFPDGARKSVERGGLRLDDLRYRKQLSQT